MSSATIDLHDADGKPLGMTVGEAVQIELVDPEGVIIEELTGEHRRHYTQASVALTYAFIMRQQGPEADWPRINQAIRERWKGKTALMRVKKMAWGYIS